MSTFNDCGSFFVISQTVEYALRAVVHLASVAPAARTTEQIATATLVPHVSFKSAAEPKVKGGVVVSTRGIGGGMSLVKTPEELTILEVVNAVEPIQRIRTCPLGLAAHGTHLCPLHKRVDNALALMEQAFEKANRPRRSARRTDSQRAAVPVPQRKGESQARRTTMPSLCTQLAAAAAVVILKRGDKHS